MSGVAALALNSSEENALNLHHKTKLQQLQKLYDRTPESVVYFLAGSLPAIAILHLKKLTLFSMITRLPDNILNQIARYVLTTAKDNDKSWFVSIRKICSQYNLPHPLTLLNNPLSKESSKKLFKNNVQDYWQSEFRLKSSSLDSLNYFKTEFMSLSRPHPLWTTCGNNSYEVSKAVIQARFLSGRYRCEKLTSHFTSTKSSPLCSICPDGSIGSVEHILLFCSALEDVRSQLLANLQKNESISKETKQIIQFNFTLSTSTKVQLLIDPSVLPDVIRETQNGNYDLIEEMFRFTRNWCFSIHRQRLKLQGKWTKN